MDDFQAAYTRVDGMPWVNTLAADRDGRAWYIDASATPNLSDGRPGSASATRVDEDLIAALLYQNRVALLDGSEPDDEWLDDPAASRPGIVAPHRLPQLERRDYLVNATTRTG